MKRASILIAALIAIPLAVLAQIPAVEDQSDQESLTAVFGRLAEKRVLRGRFTQERIVPGLSAPLVSEGRFLISDSGLYWEQRQPFRSVIIANGQRLTQIVGNQSPTTITAAEQPVVSGMGIIFLSVFRGDQAALEENFDVTFSSSGSTWSIQLEPRNYPLTETISELQLQGRSYIDKMAVTGPADDTMTVEFLDVTDDPPDLTPNEIALYSQ